jgi:HK97 family phage portal protein
VNLRARLASIFGRATSPDDPRRSSGLLPIPWIPTDLRISVEESVQLSAVWGCIQVITTAIASSPWNVYEVSGTRRELKPDDPVAYLLNQRANPEITAIAFREAMMFGALAYGNAYAAIERDAANRVQALYPLWSDRMQLTRDREGRLVYEYADFDGGKKYLAPREVFHLRGPVSVSGLLGDSIVARAAKAAALAAAAERFSLSYLANGTIPSGVLTYPKNLLPEAKDTIRAQWDEKMSGPKKGGKVVILEGGMKYEQVSADPDKAMLGPTQAWSLEQVARYFGVPLVLLGVESAAQGYGVNLSAMFLSFSRQTLRPWCLRCEQEGNTKLLSPSPYRETTLDTEWLSRGDAKAQAETDEVRIRSGVMSVNEARQKQGLNTIGAEGELRFVSTSLTPLTTTLLEIQELEAKEPEPAPPPAAAAPSEEDQDEPADGGEESPMLRQALRTMVLQNLERLEKRIAAREKELEKKGVKRDELAAKLNEDREQFRQWMAKDCYPALSLIRDVSQARGKHLNGEADEALLAAVDAVTKGKPPAAEADRLLSALLPEVTQ